MLVLIRNQEEEEIKEIAQEEGKVIEFNLVKINLNPAKINFNPKIGIYVFEFILNISLIIN